MLIMLYTLFDLCSPSNKSYLKNQILFVLSDPQVVFYWNVESVGRDKLCFVISANSFYWNNILKGLFLRAHGLQRLVTWAYTRDKMIVYVRRKKSVNNATLDLSHRDRIIAKSIRGRMSHIKNGELLGILWQHNDYYRIVMLIQFLLILRLFFHY